LKSRSIEEVIIVDSRELQVKGKREVESKGELTQTGPVFVPATDIFEDKDALHIVADMPGVNNEGVEIHLEDNELKIIGRVTEEKRGASLLHAEYESGDYLRNFTLSNVIDQRRIEASMKDGVLRILLPKAESSKPRKITVKGG
jgi:HSP20 family protein